MTTAETFFKLRNMVDDFIREHSYHWDKVREVYRLKTKEEWLKEYMMSECKMYMGRDDFEPFRLFMEYKQKNMH